jgi:hypothetical protein
MRAFFFAPAQTMRVYPPPARQAYNGGMTKRSHHLRPKNQALRAIARPRAGARVDISTAQARWIDALRVHVSERFVATGGGGGMPIFLKTIMLPKSHQVFVIARHLRFGDFALSVTFVRGRLRAARGVRADIRHVVSCQYADRTLAGAARYRPNPLRRAT